MKVQAIISGVIGFCSVTLFTVLLLLGRISELSYTSLLVSVALICVVILVLPRLKELDLKNLRLTLQELKQVKEEIAEMYGGIEKLKKHGRLFLTTRR